MRPHPDPTSRPLEDIGLEPSLTPILVGMNHRTGHVELRERLAFPEEAIATAARELTTRPAIREAVVLSTCNRVEVTAIGHDLGQALADVERFLLEDRGLDPSGRAHLYRFTGTDAVRHLFRVASSLDSMVVGEPQILGQVKAAFRAASDGGAVGPVLNRLLNRSLRVAKRVRTETRIGDQAVSIGFAAVELAQKIFGGLDERVVMLLGAGEMAELTARHLLTAGARSILVANRTLERAERLAATFHGRPLTLDAFGYHLHEADIVVCSTGASHAVVDEAVVHAALKRRRNRPMFFIDISVPRNVDPAVNRIDNAYLYDIDDLERVVDDNWATRRAEAVRAEGIVETEVEAFLTWVNGLDAHPTVAALRERWESIRRAELERHRGLLERLPESERQAVDDLTRSLLGKLLHAPLTQLKQARESGGVMYVDAARVLFDLDDEGRRRRRAGAPAAGCDHHGASAPAHLPGDEPAPEGDGPGAGTPATRPAHGDDEP